MPLSASDFSEIISDDCIYVDKTNFLANIIRRKDNNFYLSRPRRFGKTLT
ncbi:MAG: AAA family ATPase, partial [Deltaproteobacteria bacterium]|nr:AAA family ATPase [Deltaproteobacteria bacterium]